MRRVGKLTRNVADGHLKEIFGQYGRVTLAKVSVDGKVGLSKGFGFVEFEDGEGAQQALDYMDGGQLDGSVIQVSRVERQVYEDDVALRERQRQMRPAPEPPRQGSGPPGGGPPGGGPPGGGPPDPGFDRRRGPGGPGPRGGWRPPPGGPPGHGGGDGGGRCVARHARALFTFVCLFVLMILMVEADNPRAAFPWCCPVLQGLASHGRQAERRRRPSRRPSRRPAGPRQRQGQRA